MVCNSKCCQLSQLASAVASRCCDPTQRTVSQLGLDNTPATAWELPARAKTSLDHVTKRTTRRSFSWSPNPGTRGTAPGQRMRAETAANSAETPLDDSSPALQRILSEHLMPSSWLMDTEDPDLLRSAAGDVPMEQEQPMASPI